MEFNKVKERIGCSFEIIFIIVDVCAAIFCLAYFTDIFRSFLPHHTIKLSENSVSGNATIIDALTLEVNAINNILTWGSFIVAALTIAAAIFGILGVSAFRQETRNSIKSSKKVIDDMKNTIDSFFIDVNTRLDDFQQDTNTRLNDFMTTIDDFTNSVDCYTAQIDNINYTLTQQTRYFYQVINYLYQVTYSNIEQMEDQTLAQQLLENNFHELQIAMLYRTNLQADEAPDVEINRIAALEYLEDNGRIEDIPHLEYIAQQDPNERIRNRAFEIIGRIRERNK